MMPRKGFRQARGLKPGKSGLGGLDPKAMSQAMKQMGIIAEDVENVEEVIIRTSTDEYVIKEPAVTKMVVQGATNWQIIGEAEVYPKGARASASASASASGAGASEEKPKFTEDDVVIVMQQTNCTREQAIKALNECDGQPAEAIMKLIS
ncbi:MAG: nascent polypeptide-associated complex protein [Thermoplasmata archaeon]